MFGKIICFVLSAVDAGFNLEDGDKLHKLVRSCHACIFCFPAQLHVLWQFNPCLFCLFVSKIDRHKISDYRLI